MQLVFFVRMDQDPMWIDFFYEINLMTENHLNHYHPHHPNYLTRRRRKKEEMKKFNQEEIYTIGKI